MAARRALFVPEQYERIVDEIQFVVVRSHDIDLPAPTMPMANMELYDTS
jgi:hypothetical protein